MSLMSEETAWSGDPFSDSLVLQQEAADVGFDWETPMDVLEKVREEVEELHEAMSAEDVSKVSHELGDLFLALVNVARLSKVSPSDVMQQANERFRSRFNAMRGVVEQQGRILDECSFEELNRAWDAAKVLCEKEKRA